MSKGNSCYPLFTIRYSPWVVAAVAVLLSACAPKGEALYNRAAQSLDKGDVRAAVIDLKNLVQEEPTNGKARALLADALVRSGDVSGAAIELQKAKDAGAPKDLILLPECRVLIAQNQYDKVLAQCQPDAVPAAAKFEMQIAQGQALLGLERAADAKAQFEAALKDRPNSLDALLGLAQASYALDGLPAAKAVLEKAPAEIKKQTRYWMAMGGIDSQGGDFAGAEKAFATALEKADKNPESTERLSALGALAETQMRLGKVKEATATSDQLMKAAPENPLVKQLRGQVAAAGGDNEKARTLLEEAVAAMPDNQQARLLLGMVNLQQGNLGQAEMHFAAVVANQPGNVQAQRLLAETRARSQTPEQTLEGMKPALEQASADPSLLAMAGRLSLASGNREQALGYLAQASAQSGKEQDPGVQLEIASAYMMAGDVDRGIAVLEAMPKGGATGYQREYLLMAALLRKGEKDKAIAEAKALLDRSGDDPQVRNLVASVFTAAGQPDAGRAQFNEALKLKPNDPATLINLARLDLAEGKGADAEAYFRKVLETDPKNLLATLGVAAAAGAQGNKKVVEQFLQKASVDHPDSVDAQLALAQYYLGINDFGKARSVIDAAAKKAPDNAALSNARGLALLGLNDVPGAIASFEAATKQAPKAYAYSLNLARAQLVNRDPKAAIAVLDGVLKQDPQYRPGLALAAAIGLQSGNTEQAAGYIERLRKLEPEAPATLALEGDLAMAQKRYREALEDYRKASAKGTTRQLAIAEYRAGVMSGAARPEKPLEDWIAAHPDDADAVVVLADAKQSSGNLAEATTLYERALDKTPDSAVVLNNLAMIYLEGGQPAKALGLAERALKAAPNSSAIKDTYGWALLLNDQPGKAVELLGQAYAALPDLAEVQYHYAAALAKSGKTTEAVGLLKKAVAGQMPPKAKADAENLLKQLTK